MNTFPYFLIWNGCVWKESEIGVPSTVCTGENDDQHVDFGGIPNF